VPTWAGFIYLAVVIDVWRRRVVGWSIGEHMRAELVLAALNMALQTRKPDGVIITAIVSVALTLIGRCWSSSVSRPR